MYEVETQATSLSWAHAVTKNLFQNDSTSNQLHLSGILSSNFNFIPCYKAKNIEGIDFEETSKDLWKFSVASNFNLELPKRF